MASNRGTTSLKRRGRARNPMQEYDALPQELRAWVATAALPWSIRSVRVAYEKAKRRKGKAADAIDELNRVQNALIARDARQIWGPEHPDAKEHQPQSNKANLT